MKFLVIGLGSMGKRRIKNLKDLGEHDIEIFDINAKRMKEVKKMFNVNFYDTSDKEEDVVIISTPPNEHISHELTSAEQNKHFFCEAGISSYNYEKLINVCKENNVIGCPSATFRFNETIQNLKNLIDENKIGNIVTFTYHMGQYLPDWHPYENIKDFYVSKKEISAVREMIPFELQWLIWIFGEVVELKIMKDKLSSLDMDAEDVCQLIIRFESGVLGHLLIDVVSRTPTRKMRVVGEEGSIEFDYYDNSISIFKGNTVSKQKFYHSKDMYLEEMRAFVNGIKNKKQYSYTLEEDFKTLKMVEEVWKNEND